MVQGQEPLTTYPTQAARDACFSNDISPEQVGLLQHNYLCTACTSAQAGMGILRLHTRHSGLRRTGAYMCALFFVTSLAAQSIMRSYNMQHLTCQAAAAYSLV